MGKKFMSELPARYEKLLKNAKNRLVEEKGFDPDMIKTELVDKMYSTITEGIIEYFNNGEFDMVVIGRKDMSKSEEFVLGDISVKLIRTLPRTSILVVKTG